MQYAESVNQVRSDWTQGWVGLDFLSDLNEFGGENIMFSEGFLNVF